jgi:seryl-tRNA synthetase
MLDIRFIRENATKVQENARHKGYDVDIDELLRWDKTKRELQQSADELREKRNVISSQMKGGRPSDEHV